MKNFKVVAKLQHDAGVHALKFVVCVMEEDVKESYLERATSQAVRMICRSEGCPESAIKDLKISVI